MNPGRRIVAEPLSAEAFAPFGEVIEPAGEFALINAGLCRRYTDLAAVDIVEGRAGVSLFRAELRPVPLVVELMERHPLGSQCFIPMDGADWLTVVAPDVGGAPAAPRAFRVDGRRGVNIGRGVWHGVLAPVGGSGLFAVIDRIGAGANLEERALDPPLTVSLDAG